MNKIIILLITTLFFIHHKVSAQVCAPPSSLYAQGITTTIANVNWNNASLAVYYNLGLKQNTSSSWGYTSFNANVYGVTFSNLLKNTTYNCKIQSICDSYYIPSIRKGLYVNGFNNILGNVIAEDSLLKYAQGNGYNYLLLYNLHTYSNLSVVSDFIYKAKTQYGITQVGAVGETASFFTTKASPYNRSQTDPNRKIDVYNIEFEFWTKSSVQTNGYYCVNYLIPGGFSCDTAGAFKFFIRELNSIKAMCNADGVVCETYIGWPNAGQMAQMGQILDRILIHAYRVSDSDIYSYTKQRMTDLGNSMLPSGKKRDVMIIFSAESIFMGPYLTTNNMTKPFYVYNNAFNAETGSWKNGINLTGFQWFKYSDMPKKNLISSFSPTLNFTTLDTTIIDTVIVCNNDLYEQNNTSATAYNMTSFGSNFSKQAYVCPKSDIDWYKYSTSAYYRNISVTISALPVDLDIELYNSSMQLISSSKTTGLGNEVVKYNSSRSGTYYIKVFPKNSNDYKNNVPYTIAIKKQWNQF